MRTTLCRSQAEPQVARSRALPCDRPGRGAHLLNSCRAGISTQLRFQRERMQSGGCPRLQNWWAVLNGAAGRIVPDALPPTHLGARTRRPNPLCPGDGSRDRAKQRWEAPSRLRQPTCGHGPQAVDCHLEGQGGSRSRRRFDPGVLQLWRNWIVNSEPICLAHASACAIVTAADVGAAFPGAFTGSPAGDACTYKSSATDIDASAGRSGGRVVLGAFKASHENVAAIPGLGDEAWYENGDVAARQGDAYVQVILARHAVMSAADLQAKVVEVATPGLNRL